MLGKLLLITLVCRSPSGTSGTHAAEQGPPADALKQKQEEVDRLKRDLDKAQTELKRLEQENMRLRDAHSQRPSGPATASKPVVTRPLATLPPLSADEVIAAGELAAQFLAEPGAAAQRYSGQVLKIKGEVGRFDVKLLVRRYDVLLATGIPNIAVSCNFNYVDKYPAVYTKRKGQSLAARIGQSGDVELMRIGETITLKGRCKGLKNSEVVLTGCELIR